MKNLYDYICNECNFRITQEEKENPKCPQCGSDLVNYWSSLKINLIGCNSLEGDDLAKKYHPEAHKAHKEGKI